MLTFTLGCEITNNDCAVYSRAEHSIGLSLVATITTQ